MKVLVLNLPYQRKIIRKYSCSYYANGYLHPPMELVRICTIIKEKSSRQHDVIFYDAIAENETFNTCREKINDISPDVIISLSSLEFVNDENDFIKSLRNNKPFKMILIGYIPDLLPEIFENVDVTLGNDFEAIIEKTFKESKSDNLDDFINSININKSLALKFDPDIIQKHDYSLINKNNYSDLFVRGKTAFTYFSFGCPYKCTFCIRTYDLRKVYYRNFNNIFNELEDYWKSGVRNIRILDDNCTFNKQLLRELLVFQKNKGIHFNYYGLTRLDLIDNETIQLVIKLNFKSLMLGIETFNLRTQKDYNKEFDLNFVSLKSKLKILNNNRIEIVFFLLFNPITETKDDIINTLKFIKKLPIHYATLTYFTPYPGTQYFQNNKTKIDFAIKPHYHSLLKKELYKKLWQRELFFMFSFYILKPSNFFFLLMKIIKHPISFSKIIINLFRFVFSSRKDRRDYI